MVVVTWNCNMAFRNKYAALLRFCPDLLVIPECESLDKLLLPTSSTPPQRLWVGTNIHKGLGIFAYRNLRLTIHESYDPTIEYVVPIIVTGSAPFILIAIWAMGNKADYQGRYIGRVWQALERYTHLLDQPILIVGDFNWNTQWDRPKQSLYGNLTQLIQKLQRHNIHSFYHIRRSEAFGTETQPTLYLHRHLDKPYHVDYMFGSTTYVQRLQSLMVGTYAEWSPYSDHMPLIATIE